MDLANRKSLAGPIRSDSDGLKKVRQLEWVERADEEEETAVLQKILLPIFSLKKANTKTCLCVDGYDPRERGERLKAAGFISLRK